ncbi:MAG: TonB-dependent receptor, partial [Alphaproteobacteria bacterium]|nr:TonB-dependent receptor [Alphaproteobacteria bacterium]
MLYGKLTSRLLVGTAMVAAGFSAGTIAAQAQDAEDSAGIQEIIVTAQKREQSIQDVPIAVTALDSSAIAANKIEDVADLTGLVPGLVMRNTAGSLAAISFAMRGVNSNPSAPLQDKQIALNIDGVYVGGSRGTLSELMEVASLEVLRGPQGTLFGRNSTAGAINITTRDPSGELAFTQMVGYGNEDQIRTKTTIDTPSFGPFSAYVTYIHDESRGDVKNLGAGVIWDRTNPFTNVGKQTSPKWLGGRNYENVFAALKFDDGGDFTATYKFDWSKGTYVGDARVTPVINTLTDRFVLPNGTRINIPGNTL